MNMSIDMSINMNMRMKRATLVGINLLIIIIDKSQSCQRIHIFSFLLISIVNPLTAIFRNNRDEGNGRNNWDPLRDGRPPKGLLFISLTFQTKVQRWTQHKTKYFLVKKYFWENLIDFRRRKNRSSSGWSGRQSRGHFRNPRFQW